MNRFNIPFAPGTLASHHVGSPLCSEGHAGLSQVSLAVQEFRTSGLQYFRSNQGKRAIQPDLSPRGPGTRLLTGFVNCGTIPREPTVTESDALRSIRLVAYDVFKESQTVEGPELCLTPARPEILLFLHIPFPSQCQNVTSITPSSLQVWQEKSQDTAAATYFFGKVPFGHT